MTFEDMKAYLKMQFGEDTNLENVDGKNMYGVWINIAYKGLTTRHRFWGLKRNFKFPQLSTVSTVQSTADGDAYIYVTDGAVTVDNVYDITNSRDLDRITPARYFAYTDRSDTSSEGEPTEYTRSGIYLYLHPTPDAVYEIEILYRKIPTALTGTETTEIGEEWDNAILTLAAFTGFSWKHEYDKADKRKDEFMEIISGLIGIYDSEEKDANDTLHADPMTKNYGFE